MAQAVGTETDMRLLIGYLLGLLGTVGVALGQDGHPTLGQVVDTRENSALTYDCVLLEAVLHCQFAQGHISKLTPKTSAELDAQAAEAAAQVSDGIADEACGNFRSVSENLASDPPNLPSPLSGQALVDARSLVGRYVDLCNTRSLAAARSVVEAIEEKQSRTCTFSVYLFENDFTWNRVTSRWESVSPPQGQCGIVVAAFMEPDTTSPGFTFWNYRQQKLATNKTGNDALFGDCSAYPQSELTSTWQGRELSPQCDYVSFAPF